MTTPSPADMPRAGLSLAEALRRNEALHGDGTGRSDLTELADELEAMPHAAGGALARLATEQGIQPVTDPDELATADPLPETEYQEWRAAMRGTHDGTPSDEPPSQPPAAPKPQPPFAWTPGYARQPNPMARDQYVRRAGLELAVKYYADLDEAAPEQVLGTAKLWAEWIRTGL